MVDGPQPSRGDVVEATGGEAEVPVDAHTRPSLDAVGRTGRSQTAGRPLAPDPITRSVTLVPLVPGPPFEVGRRPRLCHLPVPLSSTPRPPLPGHPSTPCPSRVGSSTPVFSTLTYTLRTPETPVFYGQSWLTLRLLPPQ